MLHFFQLKYRKTSYNLHFVTTWHRAVSKKKTGSGDEREREENAAATSRESVARKEWWQRGRGTWLMVTRRRVRGRCPGPRQRCRAEVAARPCGANDDGKEI